MRISERITEIFYFIKDIKKERNALMGQVQHLLIETNTQRRIIDSQDKQIELMRKVIKKSTNKNPSSAS